MLAPLRLCLLASVLFSFNLLVFLSHYPRYMVRPSALNSTIRHRGVIADRTLREGHVLPSEFKFLHTQSRVCEDAPPGGILVVVMVTSTPKNFPHRNTIRVTWGAEAKNKSSNVRLVFLLGKPRTSSMQYKINNESAIFKDIIQQDFEDSYRNLTLKSISALKWMSDYCAGAKFMLKTDDDMIVNVANLKKLLADSRPKRYIMGTVHADAEPNRNTWSKYYTPKEVYPNKTYPSYISGTAYTISTDIIPELYQVAMETPLFHLEDVFITGMCARQVRDIQLVHHGGFGQIKQKLQSPCAYYNAISFHEITPESMLRIWKKLRRLKCF